MGRRGTSVRAGDAAGESGGPGIRPNLTGDLDEMLGLRPIFRNQLHGYDRLQVDNYAAWAEAELVTVRREVDHLLARFGECSAELEISRRLLAEAPRRREVFPVSERVQQMLKLASDEATAMTEAGAQEAERLLDEARTEADAWLRKAHQVKEMAVVAADELREQARTLRADATALLEKARADAAELLRQAAAERERLEVEAAAERERAAAAAAARLADVQAEVDDLHRQRDLARQALRGLTDRIGEALQVVAATGPDDMRAANVAVEGMDSEGRGPGGSTEDNTRVLVGGPSPVPS
jgi:cell division septum initiation protein DivIVA